jgi:Glycosyltransferase 61
MYTIPDQFHRKTTDWVQTYVSTQHCPIEQVYKVIVPQHALQMQPPRGIDPPRWPPTCHYDETFVASIPNGRFATGNCYVVAPDNKRLLDMELSYPYSFTSLPPPSYFEGTAAALAWGWNIAEVARTQDILGHWMFDILPRLYLLEQSGLPIDKYVIGKLSHPFQYESIQMLGLPLDKLIQVDTNHFHLQAKTLVAPAVPVIIGKSPQWAFQFIRGRLLPQHPIQRMEGYEKIYITRQDAKMRYVLNEEDVMNLLAPKGYKRVALTTLSMQEKIALFAFAKEIIAPIGSGNANLVFCNPGTKFIELTPYTIVDDYFWRISCLAQLEYYEVICDVELPPKPACGSDNLIVNMSKLKQTLELAGI